MTAYDLKLVQIDEYLKASGWTEKDGGWMAPEHISEPLSLHSPHREGTWSRCYAVMIQVQADEAGSQAVRDNNARNTL